MKKILIALLAISSVTAARAQSVEEAKNLLMYERYDTAEDILHDIVQKDPSNAEAWYWLTETKLEDDKLEEVKYTLASASAVANEPLMRVAKGHVLLLENKQEEARQVFEEALKQTKQKDAQVLRAIAYAHFDADSGNAAYALDLVNKAVKRDKKNPENYILMGDIFRKLSNGTESYKAYAQAVALDPSAAAAKYKLGKIFVSQNNPEMYLKYFKDAVAADSNYAPALYELYYYYYFRDVREAMTWLQKYIKASDPDIKHEYMMTDLLYASRKYQEAIDHASALINRKPDSVEARLYKLIAYSYHELQKPLKAQEYMQQYFSTEVDSNYVSKDFELMGELYAAMDGKTDSAEKYYGLAIQKTNNDTLKWDYYKKLATLFTSTKDYSKQAHWLGKYYSTNPSGSNRDLFDWGIAAYMAKEYATADTVFALYEEKYPDQLFGFYWRAKSNAGLDTNMERGLAVPYYLTLIEMAEKDTANDVNKKWLVESYAYIAAYKANTQKDFAGAIEFFKKLLVIQPENADAKRYIGILEKSLQRSASGNTGS